MSTAATIASYIQHNRGLGKRFRSEGLVLLAFARSVGDVPLPGIQPAMISRFLDRNLTIPLISNDAVDLGKKRLLEHELAELFHERPQSSLLHGWNELVVQATLSEQGMCPSLSGAGFEMLIEAESLAGGA